MGILRTVKLSVGLAVLVLAFQNCGSKGDFSASTESTDSTDITCHLGIGDKVDETGSLGSVDFEVESYTRRECKGDMCLSESIQFNSKQTVGFSQGKVSGRAACNSFSGSYDLTVRPSEGANLIKIKSLVSTLMACSELKEEQLLLQGLAFAYKITDLSKNTVEIISMDDNKATVETGTLRLRRKVVVPEPVTTILGNYKVLSRPEMLCSTDMKCVTITTHFQSDQRISFLKGNVVSGKAACNNFSGSFKFQDRPTEPTELLSISGLVATKMACANLHEEQMLFAELSKVYKVVVSANQLELITPNGNITLQKIK